MLTTAKRLSIAAATFASALGASAPANAILVVGFCSGPVCLGFNDIIVQDNMAGDTNATLGAISFETSAFGYDLLVNAAQSKPVLGSADSPKFGLTFSATNLGVAGAHSLLASDTDFTAGGGTFAFTFSGTNSSGLPGSGSVLTRAGSLLSGCCGCGSGGGGGSSGIWLPMKICGT